MSPAPNIPLPKDPRHQRFADHRLRGDNLRDSYKAAGYKLDARSSSNAKRLEARDDVKAYMLAIRLATAGDSVLSVKEKREFFARIVRTPLTKINPEDSDDPNADLVKKVKRKTRDEGTKDDPETWLYEEYEKYDSLRAIAEDNKLSGDDPEANAMAALATAIANLGTAGGTLPNDKM